MSGRPRIPIGTFGSIRTTNTGSKRHRAHVRYRDADGRVREVTATGASRSLAVRELKQRLADRPGYGRGGSLTLSSAFKDLADLWLTDMGGRSISDSTKGNYRDDLRLHVQSFFEHYTLGEITTGRVEIFLRSERAVSYSRAKHSRTVLNQIFGYALRNDVLGRNPVEGTSPLARPKGTPQALTLDQIRAIRDAAARWRHGPDTMGPKPDDKVRDAIEILLGTSMRPGEVLALRPVDITDGKKGMVAHVRGTVVPRTGQGTIRQAWPKTDASVRALAVPEFAATVIRRRLEDMTPDQSEWTIFHNKEGRPLSMHNFRRTFRDFLVLAGLEESGISPRWYRRTGATVLARGLGVDVAAGFLGHTSTAITEGHYIEPDRTIDFRPAEVLDRTLRINDPDGALLAAPETDEEELVFDALETTGDPDAA